MINPLKILTKAYLILTKVDELIEKADEQKTLCAKILIEQHKAKADEIFKDIKKAEFKVFSQFGDDGIIQSIINDIVGIPQTFIEFGVENYTESNTRFLLMNNNWKGLIFDGSSSNVDYIKNDKIYWKYNLTAEKEFITKENINGLLSRNNFSGDIGILHIDIDGNDYWIWKEIDVIKPFVVVMEYNSIFGNEKYWTVPYDKSFFRTNKHYSNLYFGVSINALCSLADEKGYRFIGCNSNGNNAYFIRKDILSNFETKSVKEGYVYSMIRESSDKSGKLTFVSGDERLELIKGMNIYNTMENKMEII